MHLHYKENYKRFNEYKNNPEKALKTITEEISNEIKSSFFSYDNFSYTAFNSASIPYLLGFDRKTNIALNSIITGGRTNNERYKEYPLEYAADVNLKSCYGTAL